MSAQTALAGYSLVDSYFASQNVKDTAALNRDIAEMNAEFAELDAYDAEIEGYSQTARYQSVIDKTLSDQQLAFAVADVDANYGTSKALVEESQFVAQMNVMEIQKQAQEAALGYQQQARQYRLGGSLQQNQADFKASQIQSQGIRQGISGYIRS